jgi:hypothetical protein
MAGTIPLSLTQQFDIYGKPLAGGQLYLIQAGTVSTPQDGFQDTNLTIKMPYPITLDAAGRVPQFFLADGTIKVRLQDKNGVVQLAADSILVIGPSAGGGGGSTVDPTQLIQTGNMILRYGVGVIAGYVRLNGLTIGNAISGATERANLDCQNLFQYLYGADPNLVVTPGGRGASAAADWAANKQIATPDWRGYAFSCLDDMGNTPAGRLSATYWGGNPILLGSVGGGESVVQTAAQIGAHNHTATIYDPGHYHTSQMYSNNGVGGGSTFVVYAAYAISSSGGSASAPLNTNNAYTNVRVNSSLGLDQTNNAGGGQPMRSIGPRKLCTGYIKL